MAKTAEKKTTAKPAAKTRARQRLSLTRVRAYTSRLETGRVRLGQLTGDFNNTWLEYEDQTGFVPTQLAATVAALKQADAQYAEAINQFDLVVRQYEEFFGV